jgi:outer membrane receptor protein involved in Fe transport
LQITGNPTRNWRMTASYAYVKPVEDYRFQEWLKWEEINQAFLAQFDQNIVLESDRTIAEELVFIREELAAQTAATGVGKLGTRHHKVSLFTRYSFAEGWLKGVYIGGGYRHQSKMFVGLDDQGNKLYGNSFSYVDALLGYTLRGLPKIGPVRLQLNVYNILNEREPLVLRYDTDHTTVFRERIRPPTTWKLTANFEF